MQLDSFQRYEVLWRRRLDRSGTLSGAAEAKACKCLHICATSDDAGHRILATLIHKPWHISRTPARKKIIADRCFVHNVSNCEATQSTTDIYNGACYDRHIHVKYRRSMRRALQNEASLRLLRILLTFAFGHLWSKGESEKWICVSLTRRLIKKWARGNCMSQSTPDNFWTCLLRQIRKNRERAGGKGY